MEVDPVEVDQKNGVEESSLEMEEPVSGSLPLVIIAIGMAGSGKTRFVHRLVTHLLAQKKRIYTINLDPAVKMVPYPSNIDIRDTVNYKEVMKHFQLGPNGAIMTSLNLFATRFDQVLNLVDQRASDLDYIIIDTPGQIEVFNWSASGSIICDSLAVSYPTICTYIADTVRCVKPVSFMSNMLYACSILYRTKLPIICALNKVDVVSSKFAEEWMKDWETYADALRGETSYMGSLSRSMSLVMDEFYGNMRTQGVSAATGEGFVEFMQKVESAKLEFETEYIPYLRDQREKLEKERQQFMEERKKEFEKQFAADMGENSELSKLTKLLSEGRITEN